MTLLTIAGGVALILFGVRFLRKGLDRLFGARLAGWMQRLASTRLRAFATGVGVSIVAPSSTTMSVLAVQTVQAGHLSARQTLAILFGADIGLTVTVQLIALRIERYAPIFILAGVLLFQFTGRQQWRGVGQVVLSLGFLFLGVAIIKDGAAQIRPDGDLVKLIELAMAHPWGLALLGVAAAMTLQSATAAIALLIGLAAAGTIALPMAAAVAWVVGANVGIGVTTLALGWPRVESRRLAVGNLLAKLATAVIVMFALGLIAPAASDLPGHLANQIAHVHTGFNLLLAAMALPLVVTISRLVERLVPDEPREDGERFGPRFIDLRAPNDSVALALSQSRLEILHMSEIVRGMLDDLWRAMKQDNERLVRQISERDDRLDLLDAQIKRFLTRVIGQEADADDIAEQMRQLRYVTELETMGDIIDKNLCELVEKKCQLRVEFSDEGGAELDDFFHKVRENVHIAEAVFTSRDIDLADQLIRHKQRIHEYARELADRHFERLNRGLIESHETSSIHLDILTHLKRINSCASHVGFAIRQAAGVGPTQGG